MSQNNSKTFERNYQQSILLVEDNKVNQMVMKRYLLALGLTVVSAENGKAAIDILEKESGFNLILMDLEMPILGGIAASIEIRDRGLTMVPILAITSHEDPGIKRLCKEARMNGFLIKPVTMEKLVPSLDKFLL